MHCLRPILWGLVAFAQTNSMRIAILMTCYNRVETTLRCLEQLKVAAAQVADAWFDVWLVDDASPDGTGDKVKAAYPEVNVIQSPGNLFWCKGMRLAWDKAVASGIEYDFYLWLNDDVMLKPDSIEEVLRDYENGGGVIVGRMSSDKAEREESFGMRGDKGDWMNGNLVLVPREVYEKIGPIYDRYYHAYGDHDYGLMAKRAGFPLRVSSSFCGVCPEQPERYHDITGRSLWGRLKLLFDPKGYNLHDAVLFRYRNWGIGMACVCIAHMLVRVIFNAEK